MRILSITDLHGDRRSLGRILEHAGPVDLILFGGDITHFGSPEEAENLVDTARQSGTSVLAVAGNCDSAAIDDRLAQLDVGIHGRGRIFRGVGLQGLSGMPPWRGTMYQFTEEQLAASLEAGWAELNGCGPHVVVSHAPPRGIVDRTSTGKQAGSTALRTFIEEKEPALVLCGHIHESRGIKALGQTTVANCGVAAQRYYAMAEVDEKVNVELYRA